MTSLTISDKDFAGIKDKVVIVTGSSSGIGLATVKRLIQHGAKVYAGDMNPLPEPERSQVPFQKVDVRSWKEQQELFKAAKAKYGKIHHVFANAGVQPKINLTENEKDDNGDYLPPVLDVIDINLIGVIYSVKLAVNYITEHNEGGSIVMTASSSSFKRFSPTDYTIAKHGVLGILRAHYCNLYPHLPVRINAIAPSWTATGVVVQTLQDYLGSNVQSPDVPARSTLLLMADETRHGQLIYSDRGLFWDIESGENGMLAHNKTMLKEEYNDEQDVLVEIKQMLENKMKEQAQEAKAGA